MGTEATDEGRRRASTALVLCGVAIWTVSWLRQPYRAWPLRPVIGRIDMPLKAGERRWVRFQCGFPVVLTGIELRPTSPSSATLEAS